MLTRTNDAIEDWELIWFNDIPVGGKLKIQVIFFFFSFRQQPVVLLCEENLDNYFN